MLSQLIISADKTIKPENANFINNLSGRLINISCLKNTVEMIKKKSPY